jgi:SAM-dependent methyltransferase
MGSNEAEFWDTRFRAEGNIWGDLPSITATTVQSLLPAGARVLDVGFGGGRDVTYFLRAGYRTWGVDFSSVAHRNLMVSLADQGLEPERLVIGSIEDVTGPDAVFDAVISHRMAHLLITDDAIREFALQVRRLLRPGGLFGLGVRNTDDMRHSDVRPISGHIAELTRRPGHLVRYWDEHSLREAFAPHFQLLDFQRADEPECMSNPVPCHLTLMTGRRPI